MQWDLCGLYISITFFQGSRMETFSAGQPRKSNKLETKSSGLSRAFQVLLCQKHVCLAHSCVITVGSSYAFVIPLVLICMKPTHGCCTPIQQARTISNPSLALSAERDQTLRLEQSASLQWWFPSLTGEN
ncbi:hypothetical protein BDV12DRAFT_116673 [Aspergillus spectabilis]